MAMKNLVESECGGRNPLMRVATQFTENKDFLRGRFATNNATLEEQFVNEYMQQQNTHNTTPLTGQNRFRMDSLLREINATREPMPLALPPLTADHLRIAEQWSKDFSGKDSHFEGGRFDSSSISQHRPPMLYNDLEVQITPEAKWAHEYLTEHEQRLTESSAIDLIPTQTWIEEYKSDEAFAAEARKFAYSMKDDVEINETEFMNFIKKVGNVEDVAPQLGGRWAEEYELWNNKKQFDGEKDDMAYWDSLAKQWEDSQIGNWVTDYSTMQEEPFNDDYSFAEENPLKNVENPFEEGLQKLNQGDIPSAVLLFEAACQQEPENVLAWQYLGTTQAENEHDSAAIQALKKCISLKNDNLNAILALAVCYTNESMQLQAVDCLIQWMAKNEKYRNILSGFDSSFIGDSASNFKAAFSKARDLFINAARLAPNAPDAEVQCGLGVLFNLSGEYAKAADCFSAALQVKPRDALLWNRLGATLANGNKSEEAVFAYSQALEISPGFIRARFNLGISCINLKAYKEAAEHFLTVLNLQNAGRGPKGVQSRNAMSHNVWSTLRLVMSFLGRHDLYECVDQKNLQRLNREFNMDIF